MDNGADPRSIPIFLDEDSSENNIRRLGHPGAVIRDQSGILMAECSDTTTQR